MVTLNPLRLIRDNKSSSGQNSVTVGPFTASVCPEAVGANGITNVEANSRSTSIKSAKLDQASVSVAATSEPARPSAAPPYDVNPMLSQEERDCMITMLDRNPAVFELDPNLPPKIAIGVEHVITLSDPTPIKQAAYRQTPKKQKMIDDNVELLLVKDVIEPTDSPWSSPVVMVPKPHTDNKEWRMCIDYRKVNAKTRKDAYPIPIIEDCLEVCRFADFFSLIDIKDAFYCIEIEEKSRPITAFVTTNGLYQYKRMPFGLTNAPASFQRHVDNQLRGLTGLICTAFFDDCLVYTTGTIEQHAADVEAVLKRLLKGGLGAHIKKSHFAYREVRFIGHLIRKGEIRPEPEKVRAIEAYTPPRNLKELRSFMGLMNYYHRFIKGFAQMALPLYALTKKGVLYEWSGACDAAFNQLRKALLSDACLKAPDFRKQFILQTDASKEGLSGVLAQEHDGEVHPVGFISRQLNKAEKNYSGTELECLAVIWAIGQYEVYLLDSPFVLVTDHSALQWMPTKKFENTRVMRWALRLQEFSYVVRHRPGKENANADALSRCPIPNSAPPEDSQDDPAIGPLDSQPRYVRRTTAGKLPYPLLNVETLRVKHNPSIDRYIYAYDHTANPSVRAASSATREEKEDDIAEFVIVDQKQLAVMVKAQREDPTLKRIISYLESKYVPADLVPEKAAAFIRECENYVLLPQPSPIRSALHYLVSRPKRGLASLVPISPRLVVPTEYRTSIISMYHDSPFGGHLGIKRTLRKVAVNYFWTGMNQDVTRYVTSCTICAREKTQRTKPSVPAGMMVPPQEPFELISFDFIGPFPATKSEDYRYVLVIIDHFSRWAIAVPTIDRKAEQVTMILYEEVYNKFGTPLRVLSDNAVEFTGAVLTAFEKKLGVKHLYSSPRHPQSNGMVERLNHTLKEILETLTADKGDMWVDVLQAAVFAYNTSRSEATGYSPYFTLFGREAHTPGDQLALTASRAADIDTEPSVPLYVQTLVSTLEECHNFIKTVFESRTEAVNSARDRYPRIIAYEPGDIVMLRDPQTDTRTGAKLGKRAPWIGPCKVRKRWKNGLNYEIEAPPGTLKKNAKPRIMTVHTSNLKPVRTRFPNTRSPLDTPPTADDDTDYDWDDVSPRYAAGSREVEDETPVEVTNLDNTSSDSTRKPHRRPRAQDYFSAEEKKTEDPYAEAGYHPPSATIDDTPADSPAAAAKRHRADLPTPIYSDSMLSSFPIHHKRRLSLPRRGGKANSKT